MVKGESDRMGFCDGMSQGNPWLINSSAYMHACTYNRYTIHASVRYCVQKCVDQSQLNDACISMLHL